MILQKCIPFSMILLVACGPKEETFQLSHTVGETSYPGDRNLSCSSTDGGSYSEARSYLAGLVAFIQMKNSQTFQGDLDPSGFCIEVSQPGFSNAFAHADGKIEVTVSLLKSVANEASLAGVLSHELAHISMAHNTRSMTEPFEQDTEYQRLKKKLDELYQQADAAVAQNLDFLDALFDKRMTTDVAGLQYLSDEVKYARTLDDAKPFLYQKLVQYFSLELFIHNESDMSNQYGKEALENLKAIKIAEENREKTLTETESALDAQSDKIGGESGFRNNWMEQEADEVGMEFYLRAGFAMDQFASYFYTLESKSPASEDCDQYLDHDRKPVRGTGSHPNNCWRVYNSQVVEKARHQAAYAEFLQNSMIEREPGALEKILETL